MSALTDFIDRIIQRFPPSFRWDDAQKNSWTEDMVRELGGFSADVLTKAWQHMVRTRTKKETPLVSECIGACLDAKKWTEAEANRGKLPIDGRPEASHLDRTAERLKLATEMACNPSDPVCRQAAKEGWIGILHDFCRKNQRMPLANQRITYRKSKYSEPVMISEIEWCRREASDFDEAFAVCVKSTDPNLRRHVELGQAMLARREKLIDRVLHGVIE